MAKRKRQANVSAVLVGLAAIAVILAVYLSGRLDWLELQTYDWRVRYANSIRPRSDIVCIFIDDTTLDRYGRWPWPRDAQAPLISIPAELGAKKILVDLTWSDPEMVRTLNPDHADVIDDPFELISSGDVARVLPDRELRAAVRQAGNVYLAFEYRSRDLYYSAEFHEAVDALRRDEPEAARQSIAALRMRRRAAGAKESESPEANVFDRARMVAALHDEPMWKATTLAEHLGIADIDRVSAAHQDCQLAALRRRCREWFDADSRRWDLPQGEIWARLAVAVSGRVPERRTPLGAALASALRDVLRDRATARELPIPLERVAGGVARIEALAPPHFEFASVAERCGFVVFEADLGGVVRRMPLLGAHGERVLPQLAFALACDLLGLGADEITASPGQLTIGGGASGRPALSIQLDRFGYAMIPWVNNPNWITQFPSLAGDDIRRLHELRKDLAHNQWLIRDALRSILGEPRFSELQEHVELLDAIEEVKRKHDEARLRGDDELALDQLDMLPMFEPRVPEIEREVRERVRRLGPAQPDAIVSTALQRIGRARSAIEQLQREISDQTAELRKRIEGKICLIGYTATSLADMKPIPTSKSAAGVMAHANLLNGLLEGRMVRWTLPSIDAALAAVLGIGVCVISVWRPPRVALVIVTIGIVVYLALAGWLAFYVWTLCVGLTPAIGAMFVSFVTIAIYRYFFVDLERRQLSTALGQYTSKEIARQVAENPELCKRAEMREVTTIFTDLKGFTSISERIGAERTQHVLNACLGRFTEVMYQHEAMVNKFIGDGIFAFWNPVIYPQPDHALLACETAVDLITALRELIEQKRRDKGDPAFSEIVLRAGIATGNAVVGPCGSEQKYDYTCIGDSVNVAARLESANKFYGTGTLISDGTRQAVGERFAFRPLGGVQVKGKTQAVQVYELLGRTGEVDPTTLEYAEAFGAAVEPFQQRDWRAAIAAFESCRARRPDDLAAQHYVDAANAFLSNPPGDVWNGAIELKEK